MRKNQLLKSTYARPYSLTVRETVDIITSPQQFGMTDYPNPKNPAHNLIPVHTHIKENQKRETFVESIP